MPFSDRLFSIAQLREVEHRALTTLPPGTLMQRAGEAAATLARKLVKGGPVLVLAGPGNNGGDALDCAARLAHAGWETHVLYMAAPEQLPDDARAAHARAKQSSAALHLMADWKSVMAARDWRLAIDGLFGIGLNRPLTELAEWIAAINALPCPLLALDVPSGLDADTGCRVQESPTVCATHTLTFLGNKPGLHTAEGRDHAGSVFTDTLQVEPALYPAPVALLAAPEQFAAALQPRRHATHKGSFGDVIVLGGASGMTGAALLAGRSAMFAGAGRVLIGFLGDPPACDPLHPELMCRAASSLPLERATLVTGPGLGRSAEALALVSTALASEMPVVLDADALNLVAENTDLQRGLMRRERPAILTPHPLEAARLLGTDARAIQSDRLAAARQLAKQLNAIAILKGSGTVIATPRGALTINPTGNPALATAGSGDVLAGLCGALLAQGWSGEAAATGAVWLHGQAADTLVAAGVGPVGFTAGELIPELRRRLNALIAQWHPSRVGD